VLCSILQHSWISQTYICRVAPQPRAGISFQRQRNYSGIFIPGYIATMVKDSFQIRSNISSRELLKCIMMGYSHTVPSRCRRATRHLGATSCDVFLFKGEVDISPESPHACNPALGGYTTQIKIAKVPSRRRRATRHLGATVFSCSSRL
jgi:hypothetical protein